MKKLKTNKVYIGNCLEVLKTFPDESLDMCITSPPYWGLRDYGTDGQIWGGDENCEHDFTTSKRKLHSGSWGEKDNALPHHKNATILNWEVEDAICNKCGAWKGELGLEPTPDMFVNNLCDIFDEVKRCLRPHGTCFVNLGDSYAGSGVMGYVEEQPKSTKGRVDGRACTPEGIKTKSLIMIPSRFAIEMINRGWILRNELIWHKPNAMPSSATDRYTVDFEKMFFFTKKSKYYFKQQFEPLKPLNRWGGPIANVPEKTKVEGDNPYAVSYRKRTIQPNKEGKNKRAVWSVNTTSFKGAHFAVYPPELIESPIDAGCPDDGVVLDPFFGSGTTAEVAIQQDKNWVGIDLNPEYVDISKKRLAPIIVEKKTRDKSNEFWE